MNAQQQQAASAQVAEILQRALSSNPEERRGAEQQLEQYRYAPGFAITLATIVMNEGAPGAVRHIAAITFKNLVLRGWEAKEVKVSGAATMVGVSDADKDFVRRNIVEMVVKCPQLLRAQLAECVKTIIYDDFPEKWPELMPSIMENLANGEPPRLYAALWSLRIVTRKYEYKDVEKGGHLRSLITSTFPSLLAVLKQLNAVSPTPPEVAELQKLICKVFWSASYMQLPDLVRDLEVLNDWMRCFHDILMAPVVEPPNADVEFRQSIMGWKAKKWAIKVINRFFQRFMDPKIQKEDNVLISNTFLNNYSVQMLHLFLQILDTVPSGGFLPDHIVKLLLAYVTSAIGKALTYKELKPHLPKVMFQICFNLMCYNDRDEMSWQEDPHEYIRKNYDIIEDMYSPRTAAINVILELLRTRPKENLDAFLQYCVQVLDSCPPHNSPAMQQLVAQGLNEKQRQQMNRHKDGAMLAIGSLNTFLRNKPKYAASLEPMLLQHVFPELTSPCGHIRARAAWLAGQYAEVQFNDPRTFSNALLAIMQLLKDPELPVRVDAVVALRHFVEQARDLNELRSLLPLLLDDIFKLMDEVENEDLVFTLETIVEKFGEEIAPFAVGLTQNLVRGFWKSVALSNEESNANANADSWDEDQGMLAASGCLRAILTILESVSTQPQLYVVLEPALLPICESMLAGDGDDVFEEVIEIISYLTYFSPAITEAQWKMWPLMCQCLEKWSLEYFENILLPMDNFISRSADFFLLGRDFNYLDSCHKIASLILKSEDLEDADRIAAPKLLECILQNCKGRVDQYVEPFMKLAIHKLANCERSYLADLLIQVVMNCAYYNPRLCLRLLSQDLESAQFVFQQWFKMLQKVNRRGKKKHFKREYDKKINILGASSMLSVPLAELPSDFAQNMPWAGIFKGVLQLGSDLKEAGEAESEDEEREEESEEESLGYIQAEDGGRGGGWDDDKDVEDAEYLAALARRAARQFGIGDEDEFTSDDEEDNEDFSSPVDSIDPFIFFEGVVKAISPAEGSKVEGINSVMQDPQQATCFNLLIAYASDRAKQQQQQQQQQK